MSYQRRRGMDITIWRTVTLQDRRGNTVKAATSEEPVTTRGWVIPQRSSRAEVPGQKQINVVRIGVPAHLQDVELWSRVEWDGRMWDIVTPPEYHRGVKRHTEHWAIDLRERP